LGMPGSTKTPGANCSVDDFAIGEAPPPRPWMSESRFRLSHSSGFYGHQRSSGEAGHRRSG
jgi:hypothetical protein